MTESDRVPLRERLRAPSSATLPAGSGGIGSVGTVLGSSRTARDLAYRIAH